MADLFYDLKKSLKNAEQQEQTSETKRIVLKICDLFREELTETDIDYALTEIFDKKDGLLGFITRVYKYKQKFKSTIDESLKLFNYLIKHFKSRLENYIIDIYACCVNLAYLEISPASVRENSFNVLIQTAESSPWNVNIDFKTSFELFLRGHLSKMTPKVEGKKFEFLGVIVKKHPNVMAHHLTTFKTGLLRQLQNETLKLDKKPSIAMIESVLNAFDSCFQAFPLDANADSGGFLAELYKNIKKIIIVNQDSRNNMSHKRAALKLIINHIEMFGNYLYRDCKQWHDLLTIEWLCDVNRQNREKGILAMHSFYKCMAKILQEHRSENDKEIFLYFFNYFKNRIVDSGVASFSHQFSVRGIGYFAGPCCIYLTTEDLLQVYILISQKMELMYLSENVSTVNTLHYLPDYIHCLSEIVKHLDKTSDEQILSLHQVSVLMIKTFPQLNVMFHPSVINSFATMITFLSSCEGNILDTFLQKTISQGVIWTCSNNIVLDAELKKIQDDYKYGAITYRNYLPFWLQLLNASHYGSQENVCNYVNIIFDELMRTLLYLINKLDISIKKKNADVSCYDPEIGMEANNPNDQLIFVNLVDFYCEILCYIDSSMYDKWILKLSKTLVKLSVKSPLISGIYKLFSVNLKIIDKLDFFHEYDTCQSKKNAYILINYYLEDALTKTRQYKGDLQISVLEMFLVAPVIFIKQLLTLMPPLLQMVFTIGKSYLSLAEKGINALERWHKHIPKNDLKPILQSTLPYLDVFLMNKSFDADPDIKINLDKSSKRQRDSLIKKVTVRKESELYRLQEKIILFLGKVDENITHSLFNCDNCIEISLLEEKNILKYNLPFKDIKLDIYIDKFIPRVVDLALSASDRRTRISACELLHAFVMLILKINSELQASGDHKLGKCYEMLISSLVRLGCDSDQAVKQLFEPLVYQLMHWQSSAYMLYVPETKIVIKKLLEGITHPTDMTVRDFSGRCLREFVSWSIKQQASNDMTFQNIDKIISEIKSFCLDTDSAKRIGAAIAFNNLYTILREKYEIIDIYWLELLYYFIKNLSLSDIDNEYVDSSHLVEEAIEHIKRVLNEKANIFEKPSTKRHQPPEFNGILLKDTVMWLMYQIGTIQANCRHICMQMFCELTTRLKKNNSPQKFMMCFMETEGIDKLIEIIEGSFWSFSSFNSTDEMSTMKLMKFLKQMIVSLECYNFIISNRFLPCDKLFNERNKIFKAISLFLVNYESNRIYMPNEAKEYNKLKCYIIVRILDFAKNMVDRDIHQIDYVNQIWCSSFWKLLTYCIFQPSSLGFDMRNKEITENLPIDIKNTLTALRSQTFPEARLCDLFLIINEFLKEQESVSQSLVMIFENEFSSPMKTEILQGFLMLHECNLSNKFYEYLRNHENNCNEIFKNIITRHGPNIYAVQLSEDILEYLNLALRLNFELKFETVNVLKLIINDTVIKNPLTNANITHGEYFFNTFKTVIISYLIKSQSIIETLVSLQKPEKSLKIVAEIMQYLFKNERHQKQICLNFINQFLHHWRQFISENKCSLKLRYRFIDIIQHVSLMKSSSIDIFNNDKSGIDKWILKQLTDENTDYSNVDVIHYKTKVICLLACLTGPNDETNDDLIAALKIFQEKHLNKQNGNASDINNEQMTYKCIFLNLLKALKISRSPILVQFIADLTASNTKHICETEIRTTLVRVMKHLKETTQQEKVVTLIYSMCNNRIQYEPNERFCLNSRFLIPLLESASNYVVEQFFVKNLQTLLSVLEEDLPNDEVNLKHILVSKINAFSLVEFLFLTIDPKQSKVAETLYPNTSNPGGKLNNTLFFLACSKVHKEICPLQSAPLIELFRIYQCAAYRAGVAVICNTQISGNIYQRLFSHCDADSNEDLLWSKIVDCTKNYSFVQEFSKIPTKIKQIINIRKRIRTEQTSETNKNAPPSVEYISTQNIFSSTLKDDVSKYDFTSTVLRSQLVPEKTDEKMGLYEGMVVELEIDELNKHECMPTICGLINHMIDEKISLQKTEVSEIPFWINDILDILSRQDFHKNVKIFFLKVIHNNQDVFRMYAKLFLKPIMSLISDGYCGNTITYLVFDLVQMIMDWDVKPSLEDECVNSKFLKFICTNVCHMRNDIFKANLELVKNIIELWKSVLTVPYDLLESICVPKMETNEILTDINIVGIFAANEIIPWNNNNKEQFLKGLFNYLKNTKKDVYSPCAEVIGMIFKMIDQEKKEKFSDEIERKFYNDIKGFLDKNCMKSEFHEKLYICLNGFRKYYMPFVDYMFSFSLDKINTFSGDFKIITIKLIASSINENVIKSSRIINKVTNVDFHDILLDRDPEIQQFALIAIYKLIQCLEFGFAEKFIDAVCEFFTNKIVICREIMYDTLIWIYNKYNTSNDEKHIEVFNKCQSVLLKGLLDADENMQEKIYEFWSDDKNLSPNIAQRLIDTLKSLYLPEIESYYLGYCSYFLLELTTNSSEYEKMIFDRPLKDCKFVDYKVHVHWRAQHATIAPLFVDTLAAQLYKSESVPLVKMEDNTILINATQSNLNFEPTVLTNQKHGMPTYLQESFIDKSSLMFTIGDVNKFPETLIESASSGSKNLVPGQQRTETKSVLSKIQRKRFLANRNANNAYFQMAAINKSVRQENLKQESSKKREASVKIHRKYRTGDFPDVQIKNSDIIKPLQTLVKRDQTVARLFYVSLFNSLITEFPNVDNKISLTAHHMANIFKLSKIYDPSLIGTFMEIALHHKKRINFEPELISHVSRKSGLLSLGCLLLEERLIDGDSEEVCSQAKRRKGQTNLSVDEITWMKLGELYKSMSEWDVVSGIFSEKLDCENIFQALLYESSGFWKEACLQYREVIDAGSASFEDYYYEACFNCFVQISEWDQLLAFMKTNTKFKNIWDQDWNQEQILPLFIKINLLKSLDNDYNDNELFQLLPDWVNDQEKYDYLKLKFSEELSMISVMFDKLERANYYLHTNKTNFLDEWANTNPLFVHLRARKTLSLQRIADINEYLTFTTSINRSNYKEKTTQLLKYWNSTLNSGSVTAFERKISYRNEFVSQIKKKFSKLNISDDAYENLLDQSKILMTTQLLNIAIDQNNFFLAKKYINKISQKINPAQKYLLFSKIKYLQIRHCGDDVQDIERKLKIVLSAWDVLDKIDETCRDYHFYQHLFNISNTLNQLSVRYQNCSSEIESQINRKCASYSISNLENCKIGSLQKTIDILNSQINTNDRNEVLLKDLQTAYLKLANCCRENKDLNINYSRIIIESILNAMEIGSSDARQLFPCLLQLPEIYGEHQLLFVAKCRQIPEWVFLKWVPQLLANLDGPCVTAISDLLIRLATAYPNALMYPFHISKKKYSLENEATRSVVNRLETLLSYGEVDTFIKCFSSVVVPEAVLKKCVTDMCNALKKNNMSKCDEYFNFIMTDFFCNYESDIRGEVFNKVREYESLIRNIYTGNLSSSEKIKALEKVNDTLKVNIIKNKLKDYCPWLVNFQRWKMDEDVEIPGQYTGDKKPLPQYHVKILAFKSLVLPQQSIRMPIKITIVGSDAKEYSFLIKFGEDLRQDQRIQQLFDLMNKIFKQDQACSQQCLSIKTYQVIPLSHQLGLIEWVDQTKPLRTFMFDSEDKKKQFIETRDLYHNWISSKCTLKRFTNKSDIFKDYYAKCDRNTAVSKYKECVNGIPWDILRQAFWQLSLSPESFFSLRHKFIKSYSVMCIANWILGIGDRHLSNSLISLKNCEIYGIDFGCAFGMAQCLDIPELVPFRLTPHIIDIMQPLNKTGTLSQSMVHCLKALRNNGDLLLSTMEVFIQEPLLDWLEKNQNQEVDINSDEWYPKQKVNQAKSKLAGAYPHIIMAEDLTTNNNVLRDACLKLLKGDPRFNIRAKEYEEKPNIMLPPEVQVKCLIDQATDENILGRMWTGWAPFV